MRTQRELQMTMRFATERPVTIGHAVSILGTAAVVGGRAGPIRIAEPESGAIETRLQRHLAVIVEEWLGPEEAEEIAVAAEDWWRSLAAPEPVEVLGAAYFAHADGSDEQYFRAAREARRRIDAIAPALLDRLLLCCRRLVGDEVESRDGWAPPGIVVIDPRRVEGVPGDIHFDWEGLAAHACAPLTTRCLSFVCVVRTPESGAALRLWDVRYGGAGDGHPADQRSAHALPSSVVRYRPGDLVVFDSTTLHRIEAIRGSRLRIAITGHLAQLPEGWRLWL